MNQIRPPNRKVASIMAPPNMNMRTDLGGIHAILQSIVIGR